MSEKNAANNNNIIMGKNQICEELARNIATESDHITLQSINWRSFADGFPNLSINNSHEIRGQRNAFRASLLAPSLVYYLIHLGVAFLPHWLLREDGRGRRCSYCLHHG